MKPEITKALRLILDTAETRCCGELHHKPEQYHTGADCPAEQEIKDAASIVRGFMLGEPA